MATGDPLKVGQNNTQQRNTEIVATLAGDGTHEGDFMFNLTANVPPPKLLGGIAVRAANGGNAFNAISDVGTGLNASSESGTGVFGKSTTGNGVIGVSSEGIGVEGRSTDGTGVLAISTNGMGCQATSTNGVGIFAFSQNKSGLEAGSQSGVAATFQSFSPMAQVRLVPSKFALPKAGRRGELFATSQPINPGGSASFALYLCVHSANVDDEEPALWAPIQVGSPIPGTS